VEYIILCEIISLLYVNVSKSLWDVHAPMAYDRPFMWEIHSTQNSWASSTIYHQ